MPSKQKQDKAGRIPKGWQKLREGTMRPKGYKYWMRGRWRIGDEGCVGLIITYSDTRGGVEPYIRRQPTKKK